jgi:CDP-glucose 4,6-dehydratase
MFGGVYQGKKVLVTGHTGFKGSWLTAWLLGLGAEVAGFSLSVPTQPSNFEVLGLEGRIRHITGDIRDAEAVNKAFAAFKPDIVFHLAAQALVRRSYAEPAVTFATNAMGTLNILEALRTTPSVAAAVLITSDKCYRNDEWVFGYRETDALGGDDPYSASKGCAEIIAKSYMRSFFKDGPRCATTRAGNVIGGGDWAEDRIVPDCARAWVAGEPVRIRSPWATRPWQHVLEPLSGYLWLGAKLVLDPEGIDQEPFNFGPAADVNNTVGEVAEALARHWPDFRTEMDGDGCAGKKECTLLKLCCDKALAHLGWKAALHFEDTIRFTAEWYKTYHKGLAPDMFVYTAGQIERYTAQARAKGLEWTK